MALWGVFSDHQDIQYQQACRAALQQQRKLQELNMQWEKKFGHPVAVRM